MTVAALTWDDSGTRRFETGVDHGVLYPLNPETSAYDIGVAWNGLTAVDEKPDGADDNPQYADNIKYLSLRAAETFGGTIEAFTYPDEFGPCDGTAEPTPGVTVGQQDRQLFGLCYRTQLGNDVDTSLGYKLHLVWGCTASPSEKDYETINDSPSPVTFSWDFTSTPVNVTDMKPTSLIVIDSTKVDGALLAALELILYGNGTLTAALPLPNVVLSTLTPDEG
jgi:hypothetical protein